MKLISMTDFVLKQSERIMNCELTHLESHHQIVDYAKFLKQPLKLEMFVPCDVLTIPMEKPKISCATCEKCVCSSKYIEDYEKAKNKVLFEGFNIYANGDLYNEFVTFESSRLEIMKVENLITDFQYSFYFTPNAIKRIFG